jgi:hypothetical protein
MPRLTWILITAIATSWLAASAAADTLKEQARKAVVAGLDAQNAGRYDEAIAHYRKAYDAVPHPEILFNLAQAYRLKGDAETALREYQRYLLVEPKGRVAADAKKWVDALEKVVAQRKPNAAKSDPAKANAAKADATRKTDLARTNAAKPDSRADTTGKPDAKADQARIDAAKPVTAKSDAAKPVTAKPDAAKTDAAKSDVATTGAVKSGAADTDAARVAAPARTSDAMSPVPLGERDDGGGISRRGYAMIAAGAGGAMVLGGAVFGALARGRRNDALAICGDDRRCDSAEDTSRANALMAASRARGTAATVLFVLGGAGVATGAVLWFTNRESPARSALAPVIAPSLLGVAWGGQF